LDALFFSRLPNLKFPFEKGAIVLLCQIVDVFKRDICFNRWYLNLYSYSHQGIKWS